MVELWGRQSSPPELLARVGRPDILIGRIDAAASTPRYSALAAPVPGCVEHCYGHDMAVDAYGHVQAAVLNRAAGLGLYQRYRREPTPEEQRHYDREIGALAGSEALREFASNAGELAAASLGGALT